MEKDAFYIEDYTEKDKKNEKESANKKKIRDALRANIQQSINYAKHKEPESKISRLKKIFSLNGEDETIITLRYGSIIFYHGIVRKQRVFKGKVEDFDSKISILERLTQMVDDNKWFNEQYAQYLKIRKQADERSAKTKSKNKSKATNKKSSAKKTSSKKVTAKASSKAKSKKK